MLSFYARFEYEDNVKETMVTDATVFDAASWAEAVRLAEAFIKGLERKEGVENATLKLLEC